MRIIEANKIHDEKIINNFGSTSVLLFIIQGLLCMLVLYKTRISLPTRNDSSK